VRWLRLLCAAPLFAFLGSGCATIQRTATSRLADALAASGTSFAADDDPELIKAAVPFSLKLMESTLAQCPQHRGLLCAAAGGFTQYAYAFVQQEAEEIEGQDVAASLALRNRARRLYLRARDYALRGLEVAHPDFGRRLRDNPREAVAQLRKDDVPLAYWAAASWAAATGVIKNDTDLIAELPLVEALIDRALVLDESYDHGAIHAFLITYEMARPTGPGDPAARARAHFARARQLTDGRLAGPFVALAEGVAVPAQNRQEFLELLHQALAVDPAAAPEWRLANLVMQRRARWLLSQADNLIASETK
jgi:predicted anti-sigma-YlaC factor YlaD